MKKTILTIIILLLIIAGAFGLHHYVNKNRAPQQTSSDAALALVLKQTKGIVVVEKEFPAPVAALALDAKDYNYNSQTGGITPININQVSSTSQKILEDNWNFMEKYKFSGTPVIFMQTYAGKVYVMTGFLMDEMLENVINAVKGPMLAGDNG